MSFHELRSEQLRQLIDTREVYQAWRNADDERRRRFVGSMRWAQRGAHIYLLRKIGSRETSLGPRSEELERTHDAFMEGRAENRERLVGLTSRLDELAPVNMAMGIGRVPAVAGRIVRRCDEQGLLGSQLYIVGTNALFAYEALAGVQVESGLTATGDIDLLYDARQRLSLAISQDIGQAGLIGLLRRADQSFSLPRRRGFRAENRDGYLVDLIRPENRETFRADLPQGLSTLPDDLEGAPIFGLQWLVNAPKVEAVVIDVRGYPLRVVAIDPRVFALHKSWVSERPNRDPLKRRRDTEQARASAQIARRYLGLSFDAADLSALPGELRDRADDLLAGDSDETDSARLEPDW